MRSSAIRQEEITDLMRQGQAIVLTCLHSVFEHAYEPLGFSVSCGVVWRCPGVSDTIHLVKSLEMNCGPLFETICSGMPWLAKSCRKAVMVLAAVFWFIKRTSPHFQYASTTIRNIFSMNGPTKLICILCHGRLGHVHGGGPYSWQPTTMI